MVDMKNIKQALDEMLRSSDAHRWEALAFVLEFIARQQGCDMEKDMSD